MYNLQCNKQIIEKHSKFTLSDVQLLKVVSSNVQEISGAGSPEAVHTKRTEELASTGSPGDETLMLTSVEL